MKKRRRDRKKPVNEEYGFGIFYIERPEDVHRVRTYLKNPANAALVVIARGLRRKDLALPRQSKTRIIRIVGMANLEALIERGELLPQHWKQ